MNLTALEQRYHLLAADFQAGRIDAAAFMAALDQLQFQDEGGRTWMIGAQTGGWYYYDGQSWRQADPHQAERFPYVDGQGQSWQQEAGSGVWYYYQPETGAWLKANQAAGRPAPRWLPPPPATAPELSQVYETRPAGGQKSILIAGLAGMVILALLVLPVGGAPPRGPIIQPSPRPPLSATPQSDGDEDGNNGHDKNSNGKPGPQGAIFGTLMDLSSGQPGAGLEISINGQIVRTDTDGSYSITGLHPGQYAVLPALSGQGVPAQGPIFVNVDGRNRVIVDLGFYSQAQPTDTPRPPTNTAPILALATPPPALPAAGGPANPRPLLLMGLGLALTVAGGVLFKLTGKPEN